MANRGTHYEEAFAAVLRRRELPYVAVDQARKTLLAGVRLKSFDFILYPPQGRKILADIKGRKLARRRWEQGRYGQSWATRDDVESLRRWEAVFGPNCLAVLVFAYWLCDDAPGRQEPDGPAQGSTYYQAGRDYGFVVAELSAYARHMRPRSARWRTVYVPARQFAVAATPFDAFLRYGTPTRLRTDGRLLS